MSGSDEAAAEKSSAPAASPAPAAADGASGALTPRKLFAENLEKSFRIAPAWQFWNKRVRKVVHGVSFEVTRGEVVGLLGPNGAGKSTSFNMVVGVLTADKGRIRLDCFDSLSQL